MYVSLFVHVPIITINIEYSWRSNAAAVSDKPKMLFLCINCSLFSLEKAVFISSKLFCCSNFFLVVLTMFFGFLKTFFFQFLSLFFQSLVLKIKQSQALTRSYRYFKGCLKKKLCTEKISTPYTAHFVQCTVRH